MKIIRSLRIVLAYCASAFVLPSHAQTLDWGDWETGGSGLYANGDSIVISSLINGSTTAVINETSTPHVITDPAFPFDNSPGIGDYGYFHNAASTTGSWSILIDLSAFTLGSESVIGFSNLDGRAYNNLAKAYATIQFYDSSGNQIVLSPASFLGNYDYSWQDVTWDANSSFNTATGRWDVAADSGVTHPAGTYFAAVADAFFLTNLPTNIDKIVYTKFGPTNYFYDSTLFYAGNAVPEPTSALLFGLAGMTFAFRRRRIQG